MTREKRITLICPSGSADDASWTAKFAKVVNDAGFKYQYWGWDRKPNGLRTQAENSASRRVLLTGSGKRTTIHLVKGYVLWMMQVFRAALQEKRSLIYVAVSFDAAMPLALLSLVRKTVFVYANLDNISTSYRWPTMLSRALRQCERFVAARSCLHLLPSPTRWEKISSKERFLTNSPTMGMLKSAREIAQRNGYVRRGVLTVYVNGCLTKTRGMGVLSNALRKCFSEEIRVLMAGQILCEEAKGLSQMANVSYLGELPGEESLAQYFRSHLVFTYYDPAVEINRWAEPNKWQDCIATGTPFLVNNEVLTAQTYISANACAQTSYSDVEGIANCLKNLSRHETDWKILQKNLSMFTTPAWDVGLLEILGGLPWANEEN
jgi:hypothetical protein